MSIFDLKSVLIARNINVEIIRMLLRFILHLLNIISINEVKNSSLRTLKELSKTAYFTCTHYFTPK